MNGKGRIAAAAATLVLIGTAASGAHAQSTGSSNLSGLKVRVDQKGAAPADSNRWGPEDPAKTFQLNSRKWGLKLDLDQPVGREARAKDVQAGAYYRITPSVRVGGAVRLDEKAEGSRNLTPRDQQPRVRLETLFQF
jgi:hypothetical protein